jgi:hypothetical protein
VLTGFILSFANHRVLFAPLHRTFRTFVVRVEDIGVIQFGIAATIALWRSLSLRRVHDDQTFGLGLRLVRIGK